MDRWMHAVGLLLFDWTPHDTFLYFNVKPVEWNNISWPHASEAHRDWTLLRTVLLTWTCNGFYSLVQREEDRCYTFRTFIDVVLMSARPSSCRDLITQSNEKHQSCVSTKGSVQDKVMCTDQPQQYDQGELDGKRTSVFLFWLFGSKKLTKHKNLSNFL